MRKRRQQSATQNTLIVGGRTVMAAVAAATGGPNLLFARDRTPSSIALEERIADVLATYDAQGNHRTGTSVDNASAQWLARQVQQSGAEPELEPFALSRVDPQSCHLRVADRSIAGEPLFDANFTDGEGVRGRLGPLGSDVEIGLAETEPLGVAEGVRAQAGPVAQARQSRHKAVVLVTRGSHPELFLLNAGSFAKPFGPPTLQVSSVGSGWLKAGPATGRGDARCPRKPDGRRSLKRHRQGCGQQPGIGAARLHGAA